MPKVGTGIGVKVEKNNVEYALKKFKRKIKNAELMVEIFEREQYTKPSDKRRRDRQLSKLRERRRNEQSMG